MVARGFKGRQAVGLQSESLTGCQDILSTLNHIKNFSAVYYEHEELDDSDEEDQVAFVACGTDEIFDPDMNYSLMIDVKTGKPLKKEEESKSAIEESKDEEMKEAEEIDGKKEAKELKTSMK